MDTLAQDLRFGLRMLLKTPVVSAVAALSLALGIAANAAMFGLLDGFLFSPMPFADQHEMVVLREGRPGESTDLSGGVSIPEFRTFVEAARSLESATAYTLETANLTGRDVPEQLQVAVATPSLFEVLGVQPALGRGFRPEEGAEGAGGVVVLTHDFWERSFVADPGALGAVVTLDGRPHTVVGVLPEDVDMVPADVDAVRTSNFDAKADDRSDHSHIAFARLRPGAEPEQLARELAGVSERMAVEFQGSEGDRRLRVLSMSEFFPGTTDRQLVTLLTFVTLFGLLIACANVANLLLGRAEARQKEVSVRTALGAGRTRIVRQLLTESVVLGMVAGVGGVALAFWIVEGLRGAMPPQMPRSMWPVLSPGVLAATVAVSVAAGVLFGLAPAVHATRADLREALGEGSRGGTASRTRKRLRNVFVVGEFAVALALLTSSAFMIDAFGEALGGDPGFQAEGLLTFQVAVLEGRAAEPEGLRAYHRELEEAVAGVPGVQGVAVMSSLPRAQGNPRTRYEVDGRPVLEPENRPAAGIQRVNPDYFATMGIEILQGRGFTDADRSDSEPVLVISQGLADREFPGQDPVGRSLIMEDESRVVVGVASSIQQDRIELAGRAREAIYLPLAQSTPTRMSFAVRVAGDPTSVAGDVRRAVWSVEPDQPVAAVRTLQAGIDESLAGPRALRVFLMALSGIALVLAAMGIYGVLAHAVAQQRREIGIRMALGAGRGAVVGMVTRTGLGLAGVGVALGVPLSALMYLGVRNMLTIFEFEAGLAFPASIGGALVAASVVATWLPARRASAVSPVTALRDD